MSYECRSRSSNSHQKRRAIPDYFFVTNSDFCFNFCTDEMCATNLKMEKQMQRHKLSAKNGRSTMDTVLTLAEVYPSYATVKK